MLILITITLAMCLYWVFWIAKAQKMDKITASLPVPPTMPVLGNAMMFIGDTRKILQSLEGMADLALKHKGSVKLWLGPKLYVGICDPEDAQVVLENSLDKDVVYRFMRPWLGHGLFLAPVKLWKSHRKVLLSVFQNKILEQYLGVIGKQAQVLLDKLSEQLNREEFDVFRYITACTLDIVYETAMGECMDVQHSPDTPLLRARHTIITILNMRLFKVWLQPDFLFNLTPYAKQQKDNIDLTNKFTDEVVKKRRLEYQRKTESDTDTEHSGGKHKPVLDLLFGREIAFTDEQLREHIYSITAAGNDTTALVIAYTLVLLGIHQGVQEKVYQEQKTIFGDSKSGATKKDLMQMNYLVRVVKESMRLYTVTPIIARNIEKDTYLPHCGVTVPAGAGAVVGLTAIHRSKAVWGPDANEFDPDRFLPERSINRHPAAFMAFSYGSRNCIGRHFGMLIIKSILSSVIRTYKIKANEIGPLKIEMLLFPIGGHRITISRR